MPLTGNIVVKGVRLIAGKKTGLTDYHAEVQYRKSERNGFETPSGKIEFYSRALSDAGYDPLPTYVGTNEKSEKRGLFNEYERTDR